MRRMSIGEVGVNLEHVLFMPMKPLRNLIIISFFESLSCHSGGFQDVGTLLYSKPEEDMWNSFRRFANTASEDLQSEFRELGCVIRLIIYGASTLGVGWTRYPDCHSNYSLSIVE